MGRGGGLLTGNEAADAVCHFARKSVFRSRSR